MDRSPRPTPRTTRSANKRSALDVDYKLLDAIGVESPNESTFDNFDPNPGSYTYEPQPSYNVDPDTCPGCGYFHYGKQHSRKDGPAYKFLGPCSHGDSDCSNYSHWIETDYIGDDFFTSVKV